nr:hypothetical protein [Pseudorhizobium flavum]
MVAVSLAISELLRFDSRKLGVDVLRRRLLGLLLTWLRLAIFDLFRPPQSLEIRSSGELHLLVVRRHSRGKVSTIYGHNALFGHGARYSTVLVENLPFDRFAGGGLCGWWLERFLVSTLKIRHRTADPVRWSDEPCPQDLRHRHLGLLKLHKIVQPLIGGFRLEASSLPAAATST